MIVFFFFSSRRRHTRWPRDWSSDVCSSDLDRAGRDVLGNDRASADEGTLTDADTRQDGHVGAHAGVAAHMYALKALRDVRAAGEGRIRQRHPRPDPRAVLENRVLRDEALGMDAHPGADGHVMLDNAQRPARDTVADGVRLPQQHVVPGLEPRTDHVAGIDHGVAADDRLRSDDGTGDGTGATGVPADDAQLFDDRAIAQLDVWSDDREGADLDAGRLRYRGHGCTSASCRTGTRTPSARSDASAASSTATVRTPFQPST